MGSTPDMPNRHPGEAPMDSLPFSLRVPGQDALTVTLISSTRFRFRGSLTLAGDVLLIEWTGSATVDEVGARVGARSREIALPPESLSLALTAVRGLRLLGGWLWPYLEITASALGDIRIVPSEDGGVVRCFLARRDRALAARLIATALSRRAELLDAPPSVSSEAPPVTTPSGGSSRLT